MSGTTDSEPVRSCIGCRRRRPRSALVRITRTSDGVHVDGPSAGRGAWLCRSDGDDGLVAGTCLDSAFARGAFARAWRGRVDDGDERTIRARVGMVADEDVPDAH